MVTQINYVKLALKVLQQWEHEGRPDDFSYIDSTHPSLGTYKEFWEEVASSMQREPSLALPYKLVDHIKTL